VSATDPEEPPWYPDLDEYREASWQHAESHYNTGTDPELCDVDDCPYWPDWWTQLGRSEQDMEDV